MRSRPCRVPERLGAVHAGLLDLGVQRRALRRGDLARRRAAAAAARPAACAPAASAGPPAPRRPSARRRPRSGSRARGPPSRRRCSSGPRAARRRRSSRSRSSSPRRRLAAQHVRADVAEAAVVRHHAHRHHGPDPLPELVRVEAADRDHAPLAAELVPAPHVALGRMVEHAPGRGEEADQRRDAADPLAGVVGEAPQLDAVKRVAVEAAERHAGPLEAHGALGERMRGEAEAARVADRPRDPAGVEAAVADLLVDPERQVVVAPERRDLLARQQQHVAVPALLAAPPRLERVVIGEQHHVGLRAGRRPRDLGHRPGPVRVRRVQVDHAGEVVHIA